MATDYRPSIAELQLIERELLPGPWDAGEDASDGEVTDRDRGKLIASVKRAPVAANTAGIAVFRNVAPALLEIAAAALAEERAECTRQESHWDYVEGDEDSRCFMDIHCEVCPVAVAREKLDAALAKVRE